MQFAMGIALPLRALGCILGIEVASNIARALWARRAHNVPECTIAAVMLADVILLMALLHVTGGPFNPFSFLYLVNIALSAVVLRSLWTWTLVVLSLACFGALFATAPADGHAEHMQMHLQGMWVAFGVAALDERRHAAGLLGGPQKRREVCAHDPMQHGVLGGARPVGMHAANRAGACALAERRRDGWRQGAGCALRGRSRDTTRSAFSEVSHGIPAAMVGRR